MFKAGDKVINDFFGEGEIVYGPYEGESYFFKAADGLHHTVTGSWCKPAPKFEAGQKVMFQYSPEGESFEVMAGPFKDFEGDAFWIVRDSRGADDMAYETHMVPVVE
jgi:hypothetical protein